MEYDLIVLTHGDAAPLPDTLRSFRENVTPEPARVLLSWDGAPGDYHDRLPDLGVPLGYVSAETGGLRGFCESVQRMWTLAAVAMAAPPFVFWLEHDFRFTRPVDLTPIADTLIRDSTLAQVSLLRPPEPHEGDTLVRSSWAQHWAGMREWMTQRDYFTTNPCLIPRDILQTFPWPDGPECEGRQTLTMRAAGMRFGVWGTGTPWVEHVGVRTGVGY